MAKLSKVDAAKAAGVSRQTLYSYLKDGRLSADADGLIDTAELLRAGFALRTGHESGRPASEPIGQSLTSTSQPLTSSVDTLDVYRDMISMLKQQLSEAQVREQAALERERNAREREALLLAMVQDMQHRYDRLLEAPRSVPAPTPPGPGRPSETNAPRGEPARGDMRRRIVALLREHPQGLTPTEMRAYLQADKPLAHTCTGMQRDGLLRRVGYGRYTLPSPGQRERGEDPGL